MHNTAVGNRQQESLQLQSRHQPIEIKERDMQEQPKHTENKEKDPKPKNIQVASASGGHMQTNIDLLKVLNFVQKTMQTLSNYSEKLQTHLDINLTHQKML